MPTLDCQRTNPARLLQDLLAEPAGEPRRKHADEIAATHGYHSSLLDPDVLNDSEAIEAGKLLSLSDAAFYGKLTAAADAPGRPARVMRTLRIIEELGRPHLVIAWLRRLAEHPNHFLRSKAVHLICSATHNPTLVARHLMSPDARTRANAVETLWTMPRIVALPMLVRAAADPHHRVALNAMLGLFLHGVHDAAGQIKTAACHESPFFRAAAAWAMGQTGDPCLQSDLKRLLQDDAERVRTAAEAAMKNSERRTARPVEGARPV